MTDSACHSEVPSLTSAEQPRVLWTPSPETVASSCISAWSEWVRENAGVTDTSYEGLWRWSVEDLEGFWSSIWTYFRLIGHQPHTKVLDEQEGMIGTRWFTGATLNWAENIVARSPAGVAVVARSQTREPIDLTRSQLEDQIGRARAGLVKLGVGRGDRVAAVLPNIPETLILLLAAASLGAVFSSCPPEFGVRGVRDRFSQIEPTVLVTIDGYRHRGKAIDLTAQVKEVQAALPSLRATVVVPYLDKGAEVPSSISWEELLADSGELAFEPVPFDHPLYILYTSGTSGPPKPIVHSHGGILIEHTKVHHLHHDLRPGDRFFWYASTGWVMWNYLMSGLLTGAAIVLFDGDPGYPDLETLWEVVEETGTTVFGSSAPYLLSCRKAELHPARDHDLSALRQVGSTGAPLTAETAVWIYEELGPDIMLVSVAGGTDVATAFVAGAPTVPVIAGEISCRCLGVKAEAFDDDGKPVIGTQGELVVTRPMPSMPVFLWGDHDNKRYRSAYFERFPGVWAHGDWTVITERGTCIITGRSDATLNRGGVRLGTSDFYSVLDEMPAVTDSLIVHLEDPDGGVGRLILFLQPAEELDGPARDRLVSEVKSRLRSLLSPRHVPDEIHFVEQIPRTRSGKKPELPIKRILLGEPVEKALSRDALEQPEALAPFLRLSNANGDRS